MGEQVDPAGLKLADVSRISSNLISRTKNIMIIKECLQCKKEFKSRSSRRGKYCSRSCVGISQRSENFVRYSHCLTCNSELIGKNKFKFCSNSCSTTFNNSNRSTESRLQQQTTLANTLKEQGKSRTDEKEIYWVKCSFSSWNNEIWKQLPGFDLLPKLGMWHPITNKGGVVRDHIISISFGWENNIDPEIISHPANCRIITNHENIKKGAKCEKTLEKLLEEIDNFENKV